MFLANNIFDIDSALDQLEENLFTSSDEKSPISIEVNETPLSQQQKTDILSLQQQHKEPLEENESLSDCGGYSVVDDNRGEFLSKFE